MIKLTRGDTAYFEIQVYQDGMPYELTERDRIEFTVKRSVDSEEVLIQKQGAAVKLLHEDTKNLAFGKYVYDVQITFENGDRDTVVAPNQDLDGHVTPNFIVTKEVNWE